MIDASIVQLIAVVLGPTGAAFVSVKLALNGMKSSVARTEARLSEHLPAIHSQLRDLNGRLSRVEGHLGL